MFKSRQIKDGKEVQYVAAQVAAMLALFGIGYALGKALDKHYLEP